MEASYTLLFLLLFNILLNILTSKIKTDKYIKDISIEKIVKLRLFPDGMIVYIENPMEFTKNNNRYVNLVYKIQNQFYFCPLAMNNQSMKF